MFEIATTAESPIELVKNEIEGNLLNITVLKGGFSTGDYSYKFEIKANGTGAIFYDDSFSDGNEFSHEVNLETLIEEIEAAIKSEIEFQSNDSSLDDAEIQSIREEITSEKLEEVFWEEINPKLEDPFFRSYFDDEEWDEEFRCQNGTVAEFEAFLKLCVLTEREIHSPDGYLVVEAETELEAAGISEISYFTERLNELVEIACEYFKPAGHRYDYNDGCYDRYSGYSISSESISVSLRDAARAPAREKMLGMTRLKKKLAEMNVAEKTIRRLTSF